MVTKYKSFFESWLNIPVEEVERASGIILTTNDKRSEIAIGWRFKLPVCAFETEEAVIISCTKAFENELSELLLDTKISEAIPQMQKHFEKKHLAHMYHRVYGLDRLNPHIGSGGAVMLDNAHFEQFQDFYRKTNPSLWDIIQSAATQRRI
jgi:hypothetical protein